MGAFVFLLILAKALIIIITYDVGCLCKLPVKLYKLPSLYWPHKISWWIFSYAIYKNACENCDYSFPGVWNNWLAQLSGPTVFFAGRNVTTDYLVNRIIYIFKKIFTILLYNLHKVYTP